MEPKPLVFPSKPAGASREPRPLFLPKANHVVQDSYKPEQPAPKALNLPSRPRPDPGAGHEPHGLALPNRPAPVPAAEAGKPAAAPHPIGLVNRAPPTPAAPRPRDRIIGGDPRAPGLVEAASAIDPKIANDPRFLGRVEAFLRLKPLEWMTWGQQALDPVTAAAQKSAEIANTIQVAQAPKWADETRIAYQKGVSFFGKKPAFYQQMLENARDMLMRAAAIADQAKSDLEDRLMAIKIDALVLQVCTSGVADAMHMQIASDRLRTFTTVLQQAGGLIASLDQSALMITKQVGDVQQLLSGVLPSWIAARGKA